MSVLLLVEGIDDYHTIRSLLAASSLGSCALADRNENPDFAVLLLEGYPGKIENSLSTILRNSDATRFGVIADADDTPASSRWRSIAGYLQDLEERSTRLFDQLPEETDAAGLVLPTSTGRLVGVWIWPDNASRGDMELFVSRLVPADDPILAYARETLVAMPQPRFQSVHRNKALIHTWLAWQDPPGKPIGTAIQAKILKHESPAAQAFLAWLTKLKEIEL